MDVYASFAKFVFRPGAVCSAKPPPFLANEDLADALLDYADVVRLAIFGHTHMDEIRLLHRDARPNEASAAVPLKLIPSITPYFGNHPAFMVADIDPHSLALKDWQTYVSPGPNGSTPPWTLAYRFSTAYHLPEFSASTVQQLADDFTADHTGRAEPASAYRQHFYPGDVGLYALGLAQLWPAYACSVREFDPAAFHACLCPEK
jgi:sphingomyelin phosphodiesterase acid-like 3